MTRQKLIKSVTDTSRTTITYQLQPNTFCHLEYVTLDAEIIEGLGFSKVCHPDKWDAERGKELARQKAVGHIVRQVLGKVERYRG